MKIYIFVLPVLLLAMIGVKGQDTFKIDGEISSLNGDSKVYLMREKDGVYHPDSVITSNNRFTFSGSITEPAQAMLMLESKDAEGKAVRESRTLYLDKGLITLVGGHLSSAVINGGTSQQEYNALNLSLNKVHQKMQANLRLLSNASSANKEKLQAEIFPENNQLRAEETAILETYINHHLDSYVSLDLLLQKSNPIMDLETFEKQYAALTTRVKSSKRGLVLVGKVSKSGELNVGKAAIDIVQQDVNGKNVSLSSLKGKFVLIDFWASWCGGCRALTPDYIKTYAAFKDKNFEILAVSLDTNRERWLKAMKEDGGSWIQTSDLKGNDNSAKKDYGISVVPQNFLVDPNGIIIARNLIHEALYKKLEEVLK